MMCPSSCDETPVLSDMVTAIARPPLTAARLSKAAFGAVLLLATVVSVLPVSAQPTPSSFSHTQLSGSQTLAISKTPGLVQQADRLLLVGPELFTPGSGLEYTALRLVGPNQLVLEFPNAELNPAQQGREFAVDQWGIQSVQFRQDKGQLYNSVRVVVKVESPDALSALTVTRNGPSIVIQNPQALTAANATVAPGRPGGVATQALKAVSASSSSAPASGVSAKAVTGRSLRTLLTPYRSAARAVANDAVNQAVDTVVSKVEAVGQGGLAPSPAEPNNAPTARGGPTTPAAPVRVQPAGTTPIQQVRVEGHALMLVGPGVDGMTLVRRFTLSNPSRLVLDFEGAWLADKTLARDVAINHANLKSVRVGQFDETTVRVVLETNQPDTFHVVRSGELRPNAMGSLVVKPQGQAVVSQYAANTLPTGELKHLFVSKRESNGRAQLRLESTQPLAFQLMENGPAIDLKLFNVPTAGQGMSYNVSQFDYLHQLVQTPLPNGNNGSVLRLHMKRPSNDLHYQLADNGKTLLLTFTVPDGQTTASSRPPATSQPTTITPPAASLARAPYRARVVVDAGHGGKDHGAIREGVREKDLNLAMAHRLRKALEARGLVVMMTRTGDSFVPLPEISGFSNRNNPDLFISVHHNASNNASIHGLETYYYHARSIPLAQKIHAHLLRQVRVTDRGVRRAKFYVINHTTAPAVLVEMGYVSNPTEREACRQEARQEAAAQGIANGVVDYLNAKVTAQADAPVPPEASTFSTQEFLPSSSVVTP